MYRIVRFFLFLFNPEAIHHITFKMVKIAGMIPGKMWTLRLLFKVKDARLEREVFGLKFDNPVGLAAGFDKDAKLFDELASFGFGFVEIGTVTPLPQEGNPKPRLFRVKEDSGIINRMGFNNQGIEAVVARLRRKKTNIIIGGNIGKNKVTPNEKAVNDYEICFEKFFPYVDYFVVNVSSPNTPALRDLQEKAPLTALLNRLQELNAVKDKRKPILLKIAPDLTNEQLNDIIEIIADTKIDGVVATNTTIDRSGLKTDKTKVEVIGNGGLSGKPVRARSTEVIKYLADKSNRAFPIIGVGGIHSAEDALEKLDAGATLLQVYTGFIYEGPPLVKRINKAILKR
ncbi:quinone-dependent dihydroorotate dehydrogenase [Flavobacteriales bacterium]|nr:quinone-dependent dihydroorotate dehydrogenase [Flavobacteriales bacterium]MDC3394826.1 quinone-dependent dihydroorotate dehydrogenase [Flavobacteriales bacterium]